MADRKRSKTTGRFVSGGQLDQYPQWLQLPNTIEAVVGTFVQSVAIQSPVIPSSNLVMETLGVEWDMNFSGIQALGADQQANLSAQITTSSKTAMLNFSDPSILDTCKFELAVIRNDATGVTVHVQETIIWHSFADSGHGPLTAARQFFIAVQSSTNLAPLAVSARILYRVVEIGTDEMLGLIQEQLGV